MSIRFRLTLIYTAILALTLVVFSTALYTIQAQTTLNTLKNDLALGSRRFASAARYASGIESGLPRSDRPPELRDGRFVPIYFQLRNPDGDIIDTIPGSGGIELPLDASTRQAVVGGEPQFEIVLAATERLLVYTQQITAPDGEPLIIQVARSLADRDRFLNVLGILLIIGSTMTVIAAFGAGWALAGVTLRPIHRLTQTAQAIGAERDLSRRVDYIGPKDEIGQLATTFNRMLAELEDAYHKVEQSLHSQQRFVADASHELRTPLTTLRGNIALLLREPPIAARDRADVLSDMVGETERLMRLADDLLTLARADARRPLRSEKVSLGPLIDGVYRQIRLQAPHRKIVCEATLEATLVGDRDALKQVLLALFDNALKHTPPSATVTLRTGLQNGRIAITLHDDGPGIEPAHLPQVFDRFYQADAARTGAGAGLGLAIARELTEAQNGTIAVESQAERGTTFLLTFPSAPAPAD
jgi:two-component system, OmpR family, sensor kinase